MAKEKEIFKMEPGSDVTISCIGNCGAAIMVKPGEKWILVKEVKFTCAKCGGLATKFKMQEEKATRVRASAPGQRRL